jgi:hypothetical protein
MKKMKITKKQLRQGLRWSVFGMAALTMCFKIAEVGAYNSLQTMVENPEVAVYSSLTTDGYLIVK